MILLKLDTFCSMSKEEFILYLRLSKACCCDKVIRLPIRAIKQLAGWLVISGSSVAKFLIHL